jgi:hypothetical protein
MMSKSLSELKRQADKAEFVFNIVIGIMALAFLTGVPTLFFLTGSSWTVFPAFFGIYILFAIVVVVIEVREQTDKEYKEALKRESKSKNY